MTNDVYQSAVQELEAILSPRVVSRSLKEGLRQLGRSPETADLPTIEQILKVQVYRQLQVSMPVTEAKTAVNDIVERLRKVNAQQSQVGAQAAASAGLGTQAERLERLQVALRPFNLYFEWPEVQKLRAQIQLLETEHASGREAHDLGLDAESQLELVVQKLEDQLVLQARELGELREALDQVRSLGGQKVRRLETFVNQIDGSQKQRQLAPAEIERARRLARDLRKLMESSVYAEQVAKGVDLGAPEEAAHGGNAHSAFAIDISAGQVSQPDGTQLYGEESGPLSDPVAAVDHLDGETAVVPPAGTVEGDSELLGRADPTYVTDHGTEAIERDPGSGATTFEADHGILDVDSEEEDLLSIDTSVLDPAVHQRLRLLDLASEMHDIAALETEYAELFNYQPALAARVSELKAEIEAERSVADVLETLKEDLTAYTTALRDDLREELEEVTVKLGAVRPEIDSSELSQAARVTLGILSSALPSLADVEHVRQLSRLVAEQEVALRRSDEALAVQLKGQNELLARLEGTLVRYEAGATASEDLERLRGELSSLRLAQEKQTLVPEVMASARQVEERIAMALAERATEASERRRARLEALRAQVEGLPVTATLSDRAEAARREIDRLLAEQAGSEAASALLFDDGEDAFGPELSLTESDTDVDVIDTMIETLRKEAGGSIRRRLQELAEEAAEVGSARLVERLQGALNELDDGRFPDLGLLSAALQQEREAARLEQVGELHRLVRAASPYQAVDSAGITALSELLADQKSLLDAGRPAGRLGEAAAALAGLEAQWRERLAGVPARLDAAMLRFAEVAKLNSDDVATVRRILTHLDSQRESLPKVSLGLRLQLESSLAQAEKLLDTLAEEYEATRVIADQLVSEGLLDDVFGLALGGAGDSAATAREAAAGREAAGSALARDQELLKRYADSPGVEAVALFATDGSRLSGKAHAVGDEAEVSSSYVADAIEEYMALSALREAADVAYPR
ncbi:MAG TPA: hypothetical protein VKZ43_04405, partial [Trueperaceae bacterium]|nr:hypothetical protein [Trueperaceae bacterium]